MTRDSSLLIFRGVSFCTIHLNEKMMMMIRSYVLIAVFAVWRRCVEQSSAQIQKPALIIDRLMKSVIDLPPSVSETSQCGSWANACPAQSAAAEAFVAENTLNENALFIEQICTEGKTLETAGFGRDICSKYFQIAVTFNKTNFTFDFGYEIYVSKDDENLFSKPNLRKNYITVKKLLDSMDRNSTSKEINEEFINLIFGEKNDFSHDGWKLSFTWISVFEVEFDFQRLTPKSIFYRVRNNNRWPVSIGTSCKEYRLADEVYQKFYKKVFRKADIKVMYSDLFQRILFVTIVLPDQLDAASCTKKWICVTQWPLIPIDQFHFGALEETMCSHMITIPIWTSTLKFLLIKVDKFIYALFQAMESPLDIVAGISGQLRMTLSRPNMVYLTNEKESDMYMDMNNRKIPIPEIIYKVVKYKPDDCVEDDSCWYSATVVIHNSPFFDRKNKICPDVTAEWGWTEINQVDLPGSIEKHYRSEYIYVCKSEPALLSRLMGVSAMKQPQKMKNFNLTELPSKYATKSTHDEPIEITVLKKLSVLTEIQSKLIESRRTSAERELKLKRKDEKYLGHVNEKYENIVDDDAGRRH